MTYYALRIGNDRDPAFFSFGKRESLHKTHRVFSSYLFRSFSGPEGSLLTLSKGCAFGRRTVTCTDLRSYLLNLENDKEAIGVCS